AVSSATLRARLDVKARPFGEDRSNHLVRIHCHDFWVLCAARIAGPAEKALPLVWHRQQRDDRAVTETITNGCSRDLPPAILDHGQGPLADRKDGKDRR